MSDTLEISKTIAAQIGHRAFVMMGTSYRIGDERSISFDIRGCPDYSKVKITLDYSDTYTVEFFKMRQHKIVRHKTVPGVYNDGLHQCIEHNTGLCLSL